MDRVEVVGMSVFGLLVVGGLILGIRQGAKQREQVARYSASRAYPLLAKGDTRLAELLAEASPTLNWSPHTVMGVSREAPRSWLFKYQTRTKVGTGGASNGIGFLAEHEGERIESPVEIFIRVPGVDAMVGGRVEAGSQEFRRHYSVACASGRVASEVVNADLERILIEHREGPGWTLSVDISARAVLVTTFWAQSDEEWDYLVELGRKLRDAIR